MPLGAARLNSLGKRAISLLAFTSPTTAFTNDGDTKLLLHYNGTNGATTTTDDNGTRTAKTITVTGNSQVSTAQSQFGGASLLLDGSGDYLTVSPVNNDLYFPAGQDVTIEMWIRPNVTQQFNPFFGLGNARGAASGEVSLYIESFGGQFYLRMAYNFGAVLALTSAGGAIVSNTWYHVAYTRQGDVHRLFLNGVLQESETDAGLNLGVSGQGLKIGSWADASGFYTGNIDEIRISNIARYTADFAVPTAAFTNDANTLLLIHANGANGSTTFTDDNTARSALTVSALGNSQISTAQSQFGGASALFDATGDYLTVNSFPSIGTGNYTFEGWVRASAAPNNMGMFHLAATTLPGSSANSIAVGLTNGGGASAAWTLYYGSGTGAGSSALINQNQWYHVAVVRNGSGSNNVKLYVDGVNVFTATDTTNITYTNLAIGGYFSTSFLLNGYIDEFRISNTARYTANFTPPTAAFINDGNTLLLIHANGTNGSTVFTDDNGTRTAKSMTMVTSATISTTQAKFGASSLYVDGTGGDYVWTADSDDWDLQAAPRTFECWLYINSFTNISRNAPNHLPKMMGHMDQAGSTFWAFGPNTEQGMTFYYWSGSNNWFHSTAKDLVTGRWYHMALIVTATSAKVYVDGVEYLSSSLSNTPTKGGTNFAMGADFGQAMNAYIDEVRVSHVNRYT